MAKSGAARLHGDSGRAGGARVDHNGTYLEVLAEPYGTPRDPESGNNNQLSFTRSEHLDSIAGPPGAGLPERDLI